MNKPSKRIQHILHTLNQSKSKIAYSFKKSNRFYLEKSFSPNKFYDQPNTSPKRSTSIGFGNRASFERLDTVEPSRYRVTSCFDLLSSKNASTKRSTFGITRDEYYKGKIQKSPIGPGAYDIKNPFDKKSFYMGVKIQQPNNKNPVSSFNYNINQHAYSKLSNFKNNGSIHMKTEYYPKTPLRHYDNKIPGPGSYNAKNTIANQPSYYNNHHKKANSSFGIGQKFKPHKSTQLGPGRYKNFSQFGNNV